MSRKSAKRGRRVGAATTSSLAGRRIEQVQEVLDIMLDWQAPADVQLSRWMRTNRKAGARDRAQVADAAFDVLRHYRRYRQHARSGPGPDRRLLAILGLATVLDQELLSVALSHEERRWLIHVQSLVIESLPRALRYSLPDWLEARFSTLSDPDDLMAALNVPAPLDVRANPLKTSREALLDALQNGPASVHDPQATPYSPWGIRLQGRPPVNRWPFFERGEVEVQDEGSQLLTALVAPRRGELVIDFCAGAGGKTLLLGALMRSTGRLYAFDVSAARLARAKPRLARSGLSNVVPVAIAEKNDKRVKRLAGKAHRVLVDAPCTGLGTLRRNPDLKWRLDPESLPRLVQTQALILDEAARCVAPGGRLVYGTCSLLPEENEEQVAAFLERRPDFRLVDAGPVLASRCPTLELDDEFLRLRPDRHGTDGFFGAVLERQ